MSWVSIRAERKPAILEGGGGRLAPLGTSLPNKEGPR